MTLKDIPTYITYKSISTSHKLCSGLCQIVLVFRSLLGVHVHIYTQSTSIYIKYNPDMNLMCKLISINFTFFFCCHLNSGTIKCQKRGWGLMLIYSVLRSWQCFMFTPPSPFPHPQNTMWNLGSMHALINAVCWRALFRQCVNVYKWSPEHNSISRQKCQHIYPTYIGIKPGISHIFVA